MYTDVTMQIGRGQFEPVTISDDSKVKLKYFRYKDSIAEDIQHADLVISHAGSEKVLHISTGSEHSSQ